MNLTFELIHPHYRGPEYRNYTHPGEMMLCLDQLEEVFDIPSGTRQIEFFASPTKVPTSVKVERRNRDYAYINGVDTWMDRKVLDFLEQHMGTTAYVSMVPLKKYYKALTKGLKSRGACGHGTVQYVMGEWARPTIPHSKLFIHDSKKSLDDSFYWMPRIFECSVLNPVRLKQRMWMLDGNFSSQRAAAWWKAKHQKKAPPTYIQNIAVARDDILVCDAVKLGREIT
jgi:hypothetical protein